MHCGKTWTSALSTTFLYMLKYLTLVVLFNFQRSHLWLTHKLPRMANLHIKRQENNKHGRERNVATHLQAIVKIHRHLTHIKRKEEHLVMEISILPTQAFSTMSQISEYIDCHLTKWCTLLRFIVERKCPVCCGKTENQRTSYEYQLTATTHMQCYDDKKQVHFLHGKEDMIVQKCKVLINQIVLIEKFRVYGYFLSTWSVGND